MEPLLHVWLFGEFRALFDHQPALAIDSPRLQLLFAYLILHKETPVSKQQLASIFWPDSEEIQARANLRGLIFRLHKAWTGFDDYLISTENSLAWNPALPFWCDVFNFLDALQEADTIHTSPERYQLLERAAGLCKGDLFPGCYEDWIYPKRQVFQQQYISTLEELIRITEAKGDIPSALRFAEQLRGRDALYEPVYLTLMRLHLINANRARALEVYQNCCKIFQEELQAGPGPEIQDLYQSILHLETIANPRREAFQALLFVGRDAEWDQLQRGWSRAAGGPYIIVIKGETGIGKSRLAEEFARWVQASGCETGSTRCYAVEGSIAYGSVDKWLREPYQKQKMVLETARLRELARILPEVLSDHPAIQPPQPMAESWQRLQFFEAMARTLLLTRSGRKTQLLLIMDDLQWCDSETLEWLHYLLRFDPARPLLIIATLRVEEVVQHGPLDQFIQRLHSEGKLEQVELGGLNQKASAALAAQILNHTLDEKAAAGLFLNTAGNPLYVVEVARAWENHQPELSIRLQGIIAARLAQLSETETEVLDVAAAIGREFGWDLLSAATHLAEEQLLQSLGALFEKRIIQEHRADSYDFIHDQIREVAYSRIHTPRRRVLHRRIADAMKNLCLLDEPASKHLLDVNAPQIAAHYQKAGSLYQAFQFYARAAEYAGRIYAHQESEIFYASAIRLSRQLNWPGPQLARLYAARGRALEHLGRFPEALQVYTDLEALSSERGDPEMQCVALARMAACYNEPSGVHNPSAGRPLLSKGLAIARAIGAHELEAQMQWSLLVDASHYGNPQEGRQAAEACLAIARKYNLKDLQAVCLHDYSLNLRLSGEMDRGTACAEEARAIFRAGSNLSMLVDSLNQQAWIDFIQLNYQSSRDYVSEAGLISRSIQNNWNLAYSGWIQALLCEAQGKWSEALSWCEESIAVGQEVGFLMSFTTVKLLDGDILRRMGRLEKAYQMHQEALDASRRQASFMLFACQAQMALDYFAAGDLKTAEETLKEALSCELVGVIGPCIGLPYVSHALAEWAARSGEWRAAITALDPVLAETRRRNLPYDRVQVSFDLGCCLEGAGQLSEAESVFLSLLPEVEKCQFHRLHFLLDTALAAHYERLGNQVQEQVHLQSARLEKSFLQ